VNSNTFSHAYLNYVTLGWKMIYSTFFILTVRNKTKYWLAMFRN